MSDSANSRIEKDSNLVSRNRPVALVINACTFIGASLSAHLLEKNIQVIGLDDLSFAEKEYLEKLGKSKDFHLLNHPLDNDSIFDKFKKLDLPRLDYAFFITDKNVPDVILGKGIVNFIEIIQELKDFLGEEKNALGDKPRLVFSSSINLYGKNLSGKDRVIKEAEVKFAKGVKHYKLNGRVVRLAEVYGPGMELDEENPLSRLIIGSLNDKLEEEKISLVFTERSLYIDDAIRLLIKSALSGATSNKIFDGALIHPLRLSEIKQVLASQVWSSEKHIELTRLPEWPTPNLIRTMKELAWSPKSNIVDSLRETIAYFKERPNLIPASEPPKKFSGGKNWSFSGSGFLNKEEEKAKEEDEKPGSKEKDFDEEVRVENKKSFGGRSKRLFLLFLLGAILIYGLVWPGAYLAFKGFTVKNHLLASRNYLEEGNFDQAEAEAQRAKEGVSEFQNVFANAGIARQLPQVGNFFNSSEKLANLAEEGIDGIIYATRGSKSLFQTTKIISGESREDPLPFYENAERDLQFASTKLSKVYAGLGDEELASSMPGIIGGRIEDLRSRVAYYHALVDQAKTASILMPEITAIGGKKSYLVLLQNNLELRPTGGFIGSYAKLDFEDGRLKNIKVDDVYNLDGGLKEVIAPPAELKNDLGLERLYLRDSNYEPDFPSSARQASFFYRKEAGEPVQGVIALDLKASANLLDAVGGIELPEYGESVNGANLFERAISHAETGFFPGSQAKKNYLTSLQSQMFNKIFYLSKQNWPAIIQALGKSLKEKHLLIYLEDPSLFSSLASSNWSGVFPRGAEKQSGETSDFLAIIESNMGANKANYYLQRKITVNASFTKEGKVMHQVKINYKNTSPSEIFPSGTYKNRIKIYTPLGSKLTKALLNDTDVTSLFVPFSDYERSGFSSLIQVRPKEQATLVFEYELAEPLNFVGTEAVYKMLIFKQAGIIADPLDFILTYPINFKIAKRPEQGSIGVQEVKIQTDLQTDRAFEFKVTK